MNNLQISSWILKELGCNCERLAQFWDFFLSFFYKIKERIIFKKSQYSSFNLTLLVPLNFFFLAKIRDFSFSTPECRFPEKKRVIYLWTNICREEMGKTCISFCTTSSCTTTQKYTVYKRRKIVPYVLFPQANGWTVIGHQIPVVKNYNFNDLGTLSSTQQPREVMVFVSYFGTMMLAQP